MPEQNEIPQAHQETRGGLENQWRSTGLKYLGSLGPLLQDPTAQRYLRPTIHEGKIQEPDFPLLGPYYSNLSTGPLTLRDQLEGINPMANKEGTTSPTERGLIVAKALFDLAPSEERVASALGKEDEIKKLMEDPDVIRKIRTAEFLTDENVAYLWAGIAEDDFKEFISMVNDGTLPEQFTSDNEMRRLKSLDSQRAQNFGFMVNEVDKFTITYPGIAKPDPIEKRATTHNPPARQLLTDHYLTSIQSKTPLPALNQVLGTIKTAYPQG